MADLSLDDIIKMNKKKTVGGNKNNQRLKNLGARSGIVRKPGRPTRTLTTQPPKQQSVMLHVSNLHYDVSNKDVKELFSTTGFVKKAAVHYDKSGRSLGTAEVVYTSRDAAIKAIKKYNDLPLDGRPMRIVLVSGDTNNRSPNKSGLGIKAGSGIYKDRSKRGPPNKGQTATKTRGYKTNSTAPRGGPRNSRQAKKPVTAEQLDADLDAYLSTNNS